MRFKSNRQPRRNQLVIKRKIQKYPPPRVVAIDVDGCLQNEGNPNEKLIKWCETQKKNNVTLILWSSRGEQHARSVAKEFNCLHLFTHIISKPGYIIDDKGWSWIKYTRRISNLDKVHEI